MERGGRALLRTLSGSVRAAVGDEHGVFLGLVIVVGCLAALVSTLLRTTTSGITGLVTGRWAGMLEVTSALPLWARVALPAGAALVAGLILARLRPDAGGETIAGVMEVVALGKRRDQIQPVLGRAASTVVALAGGSSLGQEGPIAALSTRLSAWVGARARLSDEPFKILSACGLAASLSVAYNTPIAATLFVLEIIIGSLNPRFLGPVIMASAVAAIAQHSVTASSPLYAGTFAVYSPVTELLGYALVGLATGVAAALFRACMKLARVAFDYLPASVPTRMFVGGALVGLIGIPLPYVYGNGYDTINLLIHEDGLGKNALPAILLAAVLVVGKILATSLSAGSGVSGGVFTPTLFVGAAAGAAVGGILHLLWPTVFAGGASYALLGMGGAIAGATRAPFLAIIMPFELTGDVGIFVPQMVVVILALASSRALQRESIYTAELKRKGIIWEGSPEERVLRSLKVRDIVRRDVTLVPDTLPFGQVLQFFLSGRNVYAYVGTKDGKFLGVVDIHDLKEVLSEDLGHLVLARDLVRSVPTLTLDEPLTRANQALWYRDVGQLPVVTSAQDQHFEGLVTRRDLLATFDREVLKRNVMLSRFVHTDEGGEVAEAFEIPEERSLQQIKVPPSLVGATIGEADIRRRFEINVLTITRYAADGRRTCIEPTPQTRLEYGDTLTVLGKAELVRRFQEIQGRGDGTPVGGDGRKVPGP
ncbi:MAG: chloride channel protein [Candidatus Schekmanbacteria bacterium]|nr:chloride channel protein [Candidatus Schekmanbacteria bacterium]